MTTNTSETKSETKKEGFDSIHLLCFLFVGLLAGGLIESEFHTTNTPNNESAPPTQIVGMYLNFDSPTRNLDLTETCTLILKCVDSTGRLDTGRGDTIVFKLTDNSANAVLSSAARINLVGGLGIVSIKARNTGTVTVSADWAGGYSFLRSTNAIVTFR